MLTADQLYKNLGILCEGNGRDHYHIDSLMEGLTGRDCDKSGVYMIVLPDKLFTNMDLYIKRENVRKMVQSVLHQEFGKSITGEQLNVISKIIQNECNNSTNFDKTDILFIGKAANLKLMIQFLNVLTMNNPAKFEDGLLIKLIPDWEDLMVYWYKTDTMDDHEKRLIKGFKKELKKTPFANVDWKKLIDKRCTKAI